MPYRKLSEIKTIKTLADVFELTASLLDKIIFEWDEILFEQEYRPLLKDAFNELNERSFETIHDQLKNPGNRQNDLRDEGLWREQAECKLKIFAINSLWNKFLTNPIVKILEAILKFLNKLLKSLEKVIPGIGAWKELKDVVEGLIKQGKDLIDVPLGESTTLNI